MTPLKILLADDVELFLELEKTFFRRQGVTILVARNGREAVNLVRAERPQLVFMDLYMPDFDGEEACRQIKEDPELRSTPVVMVTLGGRPEDLERCWLAGCDEIVLKPINRHQFLETAHRFLDVASRRAPRFEARLQVRFGAGRENLLENYSINVSTGGLFLETAEPLPESAPLYLEFYLPERTEPICCHGRVAWINTAAAAKTPSLPSGMGIQFVDLSLVDMQLIRDFIRTQAPF
jgi:uncharacterized protein (TIGR02266 family)